MEKNFVTESLDSLERDQQALIDQLKKLPAEQLQLRTTPGSWSVLEILYHVYLSEAGTTNYIRKKLRYSPNGLPRATTASRLRTLLLLLTLKTPIKFKAPAGLDVFPEELSIEKIEADWKVLKFELKALVAGLSDSQIRSQLFKHPITGRMDMADTARFLQAHYVHHKKQVDRLINQVFLRKDS